MNKLTATASVLFLTKPRVIFKEHENTEKAYQVHSILHFNNSNILIMGIY